YITSQNFDRRAFDYFNCITVIPGAIGVFRKNAMIEAGKFDVDTLAEDCDLTIRILRNGHEVRYASESVAMTEAPESLTQFIKQRFRWTFGIMQTFWKHKDACFNPKYKGLGLLALPNFLLFQLIIPILTPLADILMIASVFAGNGLLILLWYSIFLAMEMAGAIMAFSFEKEKKGKLWLMLLQRIIYKYFLWYVLVKSISKAIKGELISWGILKRTGSVRMEDNGAPATAA
ncbi:MAG TPA: glycosyltransferase family 2 protein, partial [Cytophagaceae bacterium]|nr:glycosyltransferase family 2 protein [Cytophagaceae bacterium]